VDNEGMTIDTLERPEILLTGPGPKVSIPTWVRKFDPDTATESQVRALRQLPRLTVVQANAPDFVVKHEAFIRNLASRHEKTLGPSKILIVFGAGYAPAKASALLTWLRHFSRAEDVEFAQGPDQAAFALQEAFAKLWADLQKEAASQASQEDLLGEVKSVIAATADLRAPSGRLSAQKVSQAFGLSGAELARLIGRKRQTVSKTDDAESLQATLRPFERIARLRSVLSGADFRSWLNMLNGQLDELSPLDVIRQGKAGAVADLAENMLLGNPT
jgi:hypothetical protein